MNYSEEEKKAIEKLESFINKYEPFVFYSKLKGDTAEINPHIRMYENYKTILNLIEKQQKEIENYKTIEKIEVDNENRLSEEEVLINTMKYYIETEQVMAVPEQENQLIAVQYILNEKNKQINNSISKDKIRELRDIDNIDLIQYKLKKLLEE